jgi:membrane-associated protease RseP (regulator of RpoE activity)
MPSSPPSSSDSPKPSATPSPEPASLPPSPVGAAEPAAVPLDWQRNAWLFLATVVSVFLTSALSGEQGSLSQVLRKVLSQGLSRESVVAGAQFTTALLSILLAHEFGHYIAARIHKVDASLPYFIPMPILSPFGTMGAVIRMRDTIATRKALLDIGASGPLAGLCLAIPLYVWGVAHSKVVPLDGTGGGFELGESLLTRTIDHFAAGPVPDGMDVLLSPVAFAAWAGMFVTMINLFPVGQLDGGHVAFALLGKRQDRAAVVAHRSMLAFFFVSLASYLFRDLRAGMGFHRIGQHVNNSLFWLVWFEVLAIIGMVSTRGRAPDPTETMTISTRLSATAPLVVLAALARDQSSPAIWIPWFIGLGVLLAMEVRGGTLRKHAWFDHPPAGTAPMGLARTIIAVVTLVFFVLLFMPTPISM